MVVGASMADRSSSREAKSGFEKGGKVGITRMYGICKVWLRVISLNDGNMFKGEEHD